MSSISEYKELALEYYNNSMSIVKLMRASRDYASLNTFIWRLYDNLDRLKEKCKTLNNSLDEIKEEELSETDYNDFLDTLYHLGYCIILIDKSKETYEDVYNALYGIEPIVSAKKETKVNKDGKTISKDIYPSFNNNKVKANGIDSYSENKTKIAKIYKEN